MAHSYPLLLPSYAFTDSNWKLKRAVAVSESPFTGAQQVHEYDLALWQAVLTLPPQLRTGAAQWTAFMLKMHGRAGTFLLGDPDAKLPQGSITGNVSVRGDVTVGQHELELQTSVLSGTAVFKVGDYIQLDEGGSAKLHMIVDVGSNGDTDGNGRLTVDIEPYAKVAMGSGTVVIYENPRGLFRMDNSTLGWDADYVSRYGFSFSCTEAI